MLPSTKGGAVMSEHQADTTTFVRLEVEEAEAQRKTFAAEDLTKLNGDLRALGTMFVDTVADTARKFQSVTTAQLTALRDHAVATKQRIQPSLEAAMTAVQKHPLQF